MFLDKAKIHIKSGSGGNGMVAWRREKYVSQGGPAGGDGGRGGDVYLEATEDLSTLLDFRYLSIFKAEDGGKGGIKDRHGRNGESITIRVPCGTIVRDADSGDAIADLTGHGQRVLVAQGGRGGRGNARFTSSVRQAPQFAEPGEPGIERDLELELKLIAEVGIIGLPNAGKSTLISVISAAKPKIADYPFTTITPNLGVVKKPNGSGVVVADIPGLTEGASLGAGLGHEFLRHVERTRLLMHLVDISVADAMSGSELEDPVRNYDLINEELAKYSPHLAGKPQLMVISKADTVLPETVGEYRKIFEEKTGGRVFVISSATRQGVDALLNAMFERLEHLPKDEAVVTVMPDLRAVNNDDSAYEVHRKGKTFYVIGGKLERLFSVTDMRNREAVNRLMNILRAMGVYDALEEAGAKAGYTVCVGGVEFDYVPDVDPEAFSDEAFSEGFGDFDDSAF